VRILNPQFLYDKFIGRSTAFHHYKWVAQQEEAIIKRMCYSCMRCNTEITFSLLLLLYALFAQSELINWRSCLSV
jgi:hypothetical protein